MRSLRLALALALTGTLLPACSVVFDGSRFTGGAGGNDGGPDGQDAQMPRDGGGGMECATDMECGIGNHCHDDEHVCYPCDTDDDGFVVDMDCPDPRGRPLDCDDGNPAIHPGAPPICDNGIDESCSTSIPGLPVREAGFMAVQEVPVPGGPGMANTATRLRVFALDRDHALVFFQISDGRLTPVFGGVPVAPMPAGVESPQSATELSSELDAAFRVWHDAVRDPDTDEIVYGMVLERGVAAPTDPRITITTTTFDTSGGWSTRSTQSHNPDASGYPEFTMTNEPALVRSAGAFYFGIPAKYSLGGTQVDAIFALGADSGHIEDIGGGAAASGALPQWSVTDGINAAFPAPGGMMHLWNGTISMSGAVETQLFDPPPGGIGRPGVITAQGASGRLFNIVLPTASLVRVLQAPCPEGEPTSGCVFNTFDAASFVPDFGPGDPLITVFGAGDEGGINLLYAHHGPMETVEYLFFDPMLGTAPAGLQFPSPGDGTITDLDLDGTLERDPGAAMAGTATLAYGYVRERPAGGSTVHVGAVRACVGYASF